MRTLVPRFTYRRAAGRSTGTRAVLLLFLGVVVLAIGPWQSLALGGTIVWDGGTGNWFGPWLGFVPGDPIPSSPPISNWTCEFCVPGSTDTVDIGTLFGSSIGAVTGTAILNSTTTVSGVALGNGASGGLQITSGGNLTATDGIVLGTLGLAPASGTLTVSSGGVLNTGFGWLGGVTGSSGSATVNGSGSQLNVSGQFLVGDNGGGTLSVQTGGQVTSNNASVGYISGSSGHATVSGTGSQWNDWGVLTIGSNGQGTLTIQTGGLVSSAIGTIAANTGSSGSVLVTGTGSQWNSSGSMVIGDGGQGTLTIQNGGVVSGGSFGIFIGNSNAGGTVTVDGKGSQLNSTGAVFIGNAGRGTLTVQSGGLVVSAGGAEIGSGLSGSVLVTGAGSQWINPGYMGIGGVGPGTLTIQNGGLVSVSAGPIGGGMLIGGQVGTGAVTVVGAASQLNSTFIDVGNSIDIGYTGQGTLTIQNGGVVSDVSATVGAASWTTGNVLVDAGTWSNSGSLDIGVNGGTGVVTIQDGGQLNAGSLTLGAGGTLIVDPATVDVNGDFTLDSGGLLSLDIAGTAPGSFSEVDITGSGFFDGTIDLDFINGFAPLAGENIRLINATDGADLSAATFEIEGLVPGFDYSIDNGVLTASNDGVSETPEPNSAWLLAGALSCLLAASAARKAFLR